MLFNCWEAVCYNPQTKSFRGTSISRTRNDFYSFAHTPSLVSLYHVVNGELVKRVQGGKKECAKLSAERTVDCAGLGTSLKLPHSTQLRTGVIQENLDERTE